MQYQIIKLIIIQLLYYLKSTQLVFFLIPLCVSLVGVVILCGVLLEKIGLLTPILEMIPQNIEYFEVFERFDIEPSLVSIYSGGAFIIYLFELILSKIFGHHIEINDRITFKHYIALYFVGFLSFVIVVFGFVDLEGQLGEAIGVFIIMGLGLFAFLVYGWFVTRLIRGFIVLAVRGDFTVKANMVKEKNVKRQNKVIKIKK